MTIKVRVTRIMLAATVVVTALGAAPTRADEACALLSEGNNDVSGAGLRCLDVPEGVDVLYVTSRGGTLRDAAQVTVCSWNGPASGSRCAIPGPSAGRYVFFPCCVIVNRVHVQFAEAEPVTGAAVRRGNPGFQDGQMFRFDDLESAAVISLVSGSGVDLRVRRGTPPTRTNADCVSAEPAHRYGWGDGSLGAQYQYGGGTERCLLDASTGPVYAFVTSEWNQGTFVGIHGDLFGYPFGQGFNCDSLRGLCSNFSIFGAGA